MQFEEITKKIMSWAYAQEQVQNWQNQGEKVVFTNGCFDLIHFGHLHYLAAARDLGQRLVVGVNSKESVQRLKGPNRPINDELTRLHTLAALQFVDAVITFGEDTPLELIHCIAPDILVKGGDYSIETIVGADFVLAQGGEVLTLPFVEGYSTTNIEAKIRGGV